MGSNIIINKKSTNKRFHHVSVIIISVILIVVLSFLPFENFFITFDSAEESFRYYTLGESDIQLIIEGENSDFIISSKKNVDTYLIIPKTAKGWKIGIGSNTKRIVRKLDYGISVFVYQYKNTKDYFITILDTNGGESKISDNYNTDFYSLEKYNRPLEKNFITYYAHIPDFNSQYTVVVNGKEITFNNQETV